MIKLDTQIDLGAFWAWWTQELIALLPENLANSLYYRKGWLIAEPDLENLVISYHCRNETKRLGEFDQSPAAKARLKALLEQEIMMANADVIIRIPEQMGMKKLLTLPEAASANIRQVLGYELDRYTPFKADQVYFDLLRLGKPVNNQVKLMLMMVQRPIMEALQDKVVALGLKPAYADYALEPLTRLNNKERYNLLPEASIPNRSQKPRILMFSSMALTFLLALTVLGGPLWLGHKGVEKLKKHYKIVEKQAIAIDDAKRGIDYLYLATEKLIAKKSSTPMLIDTLNTMSKLLHEDTWVSQVKFSQGNLELLGESANAADILATLEKSDYFKNARFISPVTQDQSTGKERFQLSTEVKSPVATNAKVTQ